MSKERKNKPNFYLEGQMAALKNVIYLSFFLFLVISSIVILSFYFMTDEQKQDFVEQIDISKLKEDEEDTTPEYRNNDNGLYQEDEEFNRFEYDPGEWYIDNSKKYYIIQRSY